MFKAGDTHLFKAEAFYTPRTSNIQQNSVNIVIHVHKQKPDFQSNLCTTALAHTRFSLFWLQTLSPALLRAHDLTCGWKELETTQEWETAAQKANCILGCIRRSVAAGSDSNSLCSPKTPPECCGQLWATVQGTLCMIYKHFKDNFTVFDDLSFKCVSLQVIPVYDSPCLQANSHFWGTSAENTLTSLKKFKEQLISN